MEIVEDNDAWIASVPDLPGCNSYGSSITEAVENLQRTKNLWIEGQYKADLDVPEPSEEEDFSGKFVLRIPKTLHRSLFYEARKQGVSLNHYASHLLSQGQPVSIIRSLLNDRQQFWQNTWVHHHQTSRCRIVSMGGKLPGNVEFVMHLRKPSPKFRFKAPEVSNSTKEQYLLK
jgi:antitoxin HicB